MPSNTADSRVNNRWPTIGQLWTFIGVALPAIAALLVPMPAVDLTYHLRAGASIIAGEGIPAVDTWTFTVAGKAWLDQQWGAQVLLAGVFQVGGWTGLALLRAALVGVTFGLIQATLRTMGCARRPAAILALGSFMIAAPALALRPQLFAIVLFAATMWILAARRAHPRRLWLIPILAAVWANVHGSFPLVLVLVGLAWLDEVGRARAARAAAAASRFTRTRPEGPSNRLLGSTGLALIGAVSAFATLVNPFGIDAWRYVANLASNPTISGQVSEWQPPSPFESTGALFYASLFIALVVISLRIRADGGRVRVETIAPFATLVAFGGLGVLTGRGLAWWALVLPVSAAALAHDADLTRVLPRALKPLGMLFRASPPNVERRRSPLIAIVPTALLAIGLLMLPIWRPVGPAGVPVGTLSQAPQGIAAELRALVDRGRLDPGGKVWNPQIWGSWLEWAEPKLDYAADSRVELFPGSLWDDVDRVGLGDLRCFAIYGPEAVVLMAAQAPIEAALASSPTWTNVYRDTDGSIWLKSKAPVAGIGMDCTTPG